MLQESYLRPGRREVLEVGGVVIGDVPSWRVDHMPCGSMVVRTPGQ